jgi:hypothetical protein
LITAQTEISIANTANTSEATILTLADFSGAILASANVTIPANGAIQGKIPDLIAGTTINPSQPVFAIALSVAGTGQLVGTSVTRGFLVPQDSVVINGLLNLGTDLQVPYFVEGTFGGSTYKTIVGINNLSSSAANVTLTLNAPNRSPITVQRTVPALGAMQGTVTEIFGVSEVSGWIQLTSSAGLSAWAAYADTVNGGISVVPADSGSSSPLIFSHIADLDPWWTGIALLNATSVTADVEIFAIDPNGAAIDGPATSAAARFNLSGGSNKAFLLGELLPRTQTRTADGGFVVVRSRNGVPLSGLELFFLRNGRVFANVPGNPSPAFTHPTIPSLNPVIDVVGAFTTDSGGAAKTSFNQGDRIRLSVDRNSSLPFQVTAQARYHVRGSSGSVYDSSIPSSAPSGTHTRAVEIVLPATTSPGTYTFEATVSYNGASVTKSSTFTVAQFVGPDVEVTRAFTANTSGADTTTFPVGQTVLLVMERNNRLTSQVTIQARYKVTGPSNFVLIDTTVSSLAPPGPHLRFIDVPIGSTSPVGVYTFEASAIYNGITSTKSSTFNVTSGPTAPAIDAVIERLQWLPAGAARELSEIDRE